MELRTYDGWMAAGRKIRAGEKAGKYLVSPDGKQSRAMFTEAQTEDIRAMDGIWTTVVDAADRPGATKRDTRPKLKLAYDGTTLSVWCGPDKRAISSMKKNGFRFERYSHRWQKNTTQSYFTQAITNFEEAGYAVEVEAA